MELVEVLLVLVNGYADITVEEELDYIAKIDNVINGDGSLAKSQDTRYQPN